VTPQYHTIRNADQQACVGNFPKYLPAKAYLCLGHYMIIVKKFKKFLTKNFRFNTYVAQFSYEQFFSFGLSIFSQIFFWQCMFTMCLRERERRKRQRGAGFVRPKKAEEDAVFALIKDGVLVLLVCLTNLTM
jgi:hypothetical protein